MKKLLFLMLFVSFIRIYSMEENQVLKNSAEISIGEQNYNELVLEYKNSNCAKFRSNLSEIHSNKQFEDLTIEELHNKYFAKVLPLIVVKNENEFLEVNMLEPSYYSQFLLQPFDEVNQVIYMKDLSEAYSQSSNDYINYFKLTLPKETISNHFNNYMKLLKIKKYYNNNSIIYCDIVELLTKLKLKEALDSNNKEYNMHGIIELKGYFIKYLVNAINEKIIKLKDSKIIIAEKQSDYYITYATWGVRGH